MLHPQAQIPSSRESEVSPPKPLWERNGYLEISLACVCILAFLSTLTFGFVYDDREQVLDNPYIQSWNYLSRDLTADAWAQTSGHFTKYYRPALVFWMRLNYTLFGVKPWGWHLTTVLLHALATVLVFRLALRLLRSRWQALIAGLIFALHPVHVESVAWVSDAPDPLFSVFFLASLLCFLRWREHRSMPWFAASLALALLTMLAKEPGISLPAVVFFYALIFGNSTQVGDTAQENSPEPSARSLIDRLRSAATNAAPFVIVAVAYLALRHFAITAPSPAVTTIATALFTLPSLLLFYIRLAVWPVGLTIFYERQFVDHPTFAAVGVPLLLLLLIAVLLAIFLRNNPQRKQGLFAIAFSLLVLGPVLWVRWFSADDFVHDRYLYLPVAGLAMLVAIATPKLGGKAASNWIAPPQQIAAVLVLVLGLGAGTLMSQTYWADDFTLWTHCFQSAPHNFRVLNNLASSLGERGDYQSAVPLFVEILRQNPNDDRAQANLGYTLYRIGALPQAEDHLSRAVQLNPSDAHSILYLGITHFKLRQLAPAEAELRRAITLDPSAPGAHLALSVVLEEEGDLPGAIRETASELAAYPAEQPAAERLKHLQLSTR